MLQNKHPYPNCHSSRFMIAETKIFIRNAINQKLSLSQTKWIHPNKDDKIPVFHLYQ